MKNNLHRAFLGVLIVGIFFTWSPAQASFVPLPQIPVPQFAGTHGLHSGAEINPISWRRTDLSLPEPEPIFDHWEAMRYMATCA